jgi:DNA repair photolyase
MIVKEIISRSILTKTRIPGFEYCVNPYVGCEHGCRYCYAGFMKRFTGHHEAWGDFVDVKVNAPQLLRKQLKRARQGSVILASVTDPYQPVEKTYRLTRGCLEALLEYSFDVDLLTRSPLCLRDLDLLKRFKKITVGFSIATHDEEVKKLFEPRASTIRSRVEALRTLHDGTINTYAFIGPMLPLDPPRLVSMLEGTVDEVLIDRMNYPSKVRGIYRRAGLERYLEEDYFTFFGRDLKERFEKAGIPVTMCF